MGARMAFPYPSRLPAPMGPPRFGNRDSRTPSRMRPMRTSPGGFTLVELSIVLVVLAVLTLLAVPAFSRLLESVRTDMAFHAASASLATARISAVTEQVPFSVCPSADGRSCRRDLAWENGWIVFLDRRRTGTPGAPEDVRQWLTPDLHGLAMRGTVGRHYVRFRPDGFSYGTNLTLRLCARKPARLLGEIVVNNAGRTRSRRAAGAEPCPFEP